jgi:hypothetical protein
VTAGGRAGGTAPAVPFRELADRAALADLINRYLLSLDEGTFDETLVREVFTEDVELSFPPGDHQGAQGLAGFTGGFMAHWDRTHHLCSGYAIEPDGDRATVGWNVIATHVHHGSPPPPAPGDLFQLGGRFSGQAVRTARGWRLRRLALRVVWTAGRGIPSIAAVMAGTRGNQESVL